MTLQQAVQGAGTGCKGSAAGHAHPVLHLRLAHVLQSSLQTTQPQCKMHLYRHAVFSIYDHIRIRVPCIAMACNIQEEPQARVVCFKALYHTRLVIDTDLFSHYQF